MARVGDVRGACSAPEANEWPRATTGGSQPPPWYNGRACSCRSGRPLGHHCRPLHRAFGTGAVRKLALTYRRRPTACAPRNDQDMTRDLCQRDAWGCPSILISSPLLAFVVIYNSHHPLGARMDMDVLDYDRLAVPPPVSVDGFNQFVLEPEQLDGERSVYRDVFFPKVPLRKLQHPERRKAGDGGLRGQ